MPTPIAHLRDDAIVVFIDETGIKDYSDPKYPIFGRGGCATLGKRYKHGIKKPWHRLKREYLGGAMKPFHTTAFEQSRPSTRQIFAINRFVSGPFHRFAVMTTRKTDRPDDVDGHNRANDGRSSEWTELAFELLKNTPDPKALLKLFLPKFTPNSWSGSMTNILRRNAAFLDDLRPFVSPEMNTEITEMKAQLEKDAELWIPLEDKVDQRRVMSESW